jgi:hypothetical protein
MTVLPSYAYVSGMNKVSPHRGKLMMGKGTSVLLNNGGSGAASSYDGIDDYLKQTDRSLVGSGALSKKLQSFSINSSKPKPKNIRFNL